MRITKLDPYAVENQRSKNRVSSSSQDKGLSILAKKKLQLHGAGMEGQQLQRQQGYGMYEGDVKSGNNENFDTREEGVYSLTASKKALFG